MFSGSCGKKIVAALVGAVALAAASAAKAESITFASDDIHVASSTSFASPYTGTLAFSLTPASSFTVNVSSLPSLSPFNYSVDGTGSNVIGKIQAFTASISVVNNVIQPGGTFALTLSDLVGGQGGTVSGVIASGGVLSTVIPSSLTASLSSISFTG